MEFITYQLPDGRIVEVDITVAKNSPTIEFQLRDGTIVTAVIVSLLLEK